MLSNFCHWLDRAGVLGYTMLLTTDEPTWHTLAARGFPVLLDRVFPEREEYRAGGGSAPSTPNRCSRVTGHPRGAALAALRCHGTSCMPTCLPAPLKVHPEVAAAAAAPQGV